MTAERPNIVTMATGLVFIALGILLLFETHNLITIRQIIQWWPLALVVIGGATVWQATRGGDAAKNIPIGGLLWIVALAVLFSYTFDRRATGDNTAAGEIDVFSVFAEHHPAVTGVVRGAKVTAVMGGANLDLRQASVAPGETVVLDVFAVMGGGNIYVPQNWDVSIETNALMGAVQDQRGSSRHGNDQSFEPGAVPAASQPASPGRLVLRGTVIMGGFTIKS